MAPVGGRSRCGYLSARLIFVCAILHCITYTTCYSVHREEITLKVSHESEVGTLVLKSVFNSTCTEFSHIQRSASKSATLFVINNNEDLVVSAPLQQHVGDLFILKPRPIPSCFNLAESVSKSHHVNIEITHSDHIMTFVKPLFFGTIGKNAPPRTEIRGIDNLFACSLEACSSNIDYRIVGSNHFYLETVNVRGQIMLQIFSRESLQYSLENIHNFIITAENAKGLTGHTNIQIQILDIDFEKDETLHYVPKGSHRVRRATQETRSVILLPENSVGTLFTITDPNVGNEAVNYTLLSSTLQNTFIVNRNGDVTLAPAARWDYERFVAENIPTQVTLTVEVKRISDGIVVRDIIQPVTITDVNDENPVFTNKPVPFLATVNMQAPSGTLVYTLTVMDPDAGAIISLQDNTSDANTAIHFSVTVRVGSSVEIRTKDSGGFIPNTEYLVKVKATDTAATPPQETIATVRVKAGNREPQFGEPSYSVSFVEKNLAPQIIKAGITAKSFQDNPITFDVLEQDGQTVSSLFRMDPNNNQSGQMRRGDLVVTTTMDYERDPELYQVYIRAREDRTGLSSSVNLTITLMDWNEFEPRFTLSTYQTPNAVREDITVGSAVITVTATDQDKNTKLTFSVDDDHFRVESALPDSTNNPHTATIYVAKALDYDRRPIKMYDFSVRALDSGTNPSALSGKATVRVTLMNLNDESPEFPPLMDAKIRFDANVGREVYTVRATDADAGDTVSYRFTIPSAYPNFELETTSGRITVKQKFAETQEQITQFEYNLDVIATDDGQCCGGLTRKSSTGVVMVTILTDNSKHPSFPDCSTYDFSVQEDAQDVKVGTAKAVDQDFGINGEVTYSIRESNSKFRINATTGDIFTAVKIDRETNPRETVNIIATDGGKLTGLCPLIIQINDINDNVPTFVQNKYTFSVLNTLSVDSVAMTVQARDNDIGKNAEIDYILLENPGGYFKFDTVGLKTGQLKVNRTLPTNTNGLPFDLLVQARDLGVPPQHSNVTVAVTLVENVSQLPPRWETTTAVFSVPENQGLGSTLTTLKALSQLNNSKILSFGIADITGDGYVPGSGSPFRLQDTEPEGDVQVTQLQLSGALDYETTKQFIVTLRATDTSTNALSTDFKVTINIEDVNDNSPEFPGRNAATFYWELSLFEGDYRNSTETPYGKRVGQIIATDRDGPPLNNEIESYEITSPNFTIDTTTGWVYTKSEFDRETESQKIFTVKAVDGAPSSFNPPSHNTGSTLVLVTIEDVNDNAPYFPSNFTFYVKEDASIGHVVNQTKAIDPDSAAILQYMLPSNLPFTIQSETAEIKVAGRLDYDLGQRVYNFKVTVDDSKFRSSADVTIYVENVNDNPPVVKSYTFLDLTENDQSLVNKVLVKINVTDVDNTGDRFYYSLLFTDDIERQYFQINQNGEVIIVKALDRDFPNGKAQFLFTVEVGDEDPNTGKPLYGYGTVTIRPIDVNDNSPFFPQDALNMRVMENKPNGTFVGRVSVEDYDDPDTANAQITIQIDDNPFFELTNEFDLRTKMEFDREKTDSYQVVVRARDGGLQPLSGTGTLTITIGDENDNAPIFNTTYETIFSEHQTSGEIITITATDADIGENARLTYFLKGQDLTYFQMDTENNKGVLQIYREVDFDKDQRSFNLTAYVRDNEYEDSTFIVLIVTDYNDEVPKFEKEHQSATAAENVPQGHFLAHFSAMDADVDPNYGSFQYYISRKTDPLRQFMINETGHVTVWHSLDRETNAMHIVEILAIDNVNGQIQNTGTATLTVTVGDINDNYPDFAEVYTPFIMENQPYDDASVLVIQAVDADEDTNGPPFNFELQCNDPKASKLFCDRFRLQVNRAGDSGRGTFNVRVTGIFDRENDAGEKVITLPIRMCDLYNMGRVDQQCGIRYLYVTINDIDDNVHSDANQHILVYNYKGKFSDFKIGTVTVNDPDDPDSNDDKSFNLQNEAVAGLFVKVDKDNGDITLQRKVPELVFAIDVEVVDSKLRSATTKIIIEHVFIPDDAVYSSGSVRINGITQTDFLTKPPISGTPNFGSSMYDKFREQLAQRLYGSATPSQLDKVQILSVMGSPANPSGEIYTDVRYAAHGSPYYQSSRLDGIVTADKDIFDSFMTTRGVTNEGEIDMVPIDMCQFETCEGGCWNELKVKDQPELIDTMGASYVGVSTEVVGTCGCRAKDVSSEIKCTPGYCYHGGECIQDEFGVVSCQCPAGFDGPRCQELRQSFDGSGYALYPQLEQCEQSRTTIEILTTSADAIVLYNGPTAPLSQSDPRDFILLELVNGYPRLRVNHGTGEVSIEIPGSRRKRLNDNTWHRIDIIRNKKFVRLMVDNCVDSVVTGEKEDRSSCEGSGYTKGENIYINVGEVLQLGGRLSQPPYPPSVANNNFTGCMKNLKHNAQLYDLSTGGQFPGSVDGCPREDNKCGVDGCGNGKCLTTGPGASQWICDCDPGYRPEAGNQNPKTCTTATDRVHLLTESFLDWNLKTAFKQLLSVKKMTVSFHYRTRDTDGTVFSVKDEANSNNHIILMIVNSYMRVSYNLGDGLYSLELSNVKASDGQWHRITLERYGKEFILKMDGGEGRYYIDTQGTVGGAVEFSINDNQVNAGAKLRYQGAQPSYGSDDFTDSCLNDIRMDHEWFPMSKEPSSTAAVLQFSENIETGCSKDDCINKCPDPVSICVPLWGSFDCICPEHYINSRNTCIPIDYCADGPCFGPSTCENNVPPGLNENPFMCICREGWYGPLCQCHAAVDAGSDVCRRQGDEEPVVGAASGLIVGIVLGVLFLIAAVILIACFLMRRKSAPGKGDLLDDDDMDEIRENVMYYDEEGAGEEDQTQYDLSRLRKPDTGEHPSNWDVTDLPKTTATPLGKASDRPDIGDFISGRLDDADDDPSGPPYDTPQKFDFEGGNSSVGSLSSLNTSSSGDQDYDYLGEWGPKFKKLADMYNNYDDTE